MSETLGWEKFYFSVHPQIFRVDTVRAFDLFFKDPDGNIGTFQPADETLSAVQHRRILNEKIPALYVRVGDKTRYTRFLEETFHFVMTDPVTSVEEKGAISHEVLTFLAMTTFSLPGAEIVASFKMAIQQVAEFVLKNDEGIKYLIRQTNNGYQEYNHAVNVGVFGLGLAKEVFGDNPEHRMDEIAQGFFLHDIGKYVIPRHISLRNGMLSPEEINTMRKHPEQGYRILQTFNALTDIIAAIVLQHHERRDGKGYPHGLKGDSIHPYARICTIADIFDALTSARPYRTPKSSFNALAIMQNEMKGEFDPAIFSRFVRLFSKM